MVSLEFNPRSTTYNRHCPEGKPMRKNVARVLWPIRWHGEMSQITVDVISAKRYLYLDYALELR